MSATSWTFRGSQIIKKQNKNKQNVKSFLNSDIYTTHFNWHVDIHVAREVALGIIS